jgi:hypothetical protein
VQTPCKYAVGTFIDNTGISGASNFFDGDLYAAGFCKGAISAPELANLQTYFVSKYPIAGARLTYRGAGSMTATSGASTGIWTNCPIGPAYSTRRFIGLLIQYDPNLSLPTNIQIDGSTSGVVVTNVIDGASGQETTIRLVSKIITSGSTCNVTADFATGQFGLSQMHSFIIDNSQLVSWPPTIYSNVDSGPAQNQTLTATTVADGSDIILVNGWYGGAGSTTIITNDFNTRFNIIDNTNAGNFAWVNGILGGSSKQVTTQVATQGTNFSANFMAVIR